MRAYDKKKEHKTLCRKKVREGLINDAKTGQFRRVDGRPGDSTAFKHMSDGYKFNH